MIVILIVSRRLSMPAQGLRITQFYSFSSMVFIDLNLFMLSN